MRDFLEYLMSGFVETVKQLCYKSLEVLLSLKEWKFIDQLFLIPLTMWTTIETAYLTAQFTRVRAFFDTNFHQFSSLGVYHLSSWHSVTNNSFLSLILLMKITLVTLD